jgi:quercetin dioxygenase-like cupin family protein
MRRRIAAGLVGLAFVIAATASVVLATPAMGFIAATVFARGALTTPVHAFSDHIVLFALHRTDHVVQQIVWGAGSSSGWHRHPGVVLVTVQSGTLVFYDSECRVKTYTAGQTFWESGQRAGLVRNETSADATVHATYLVPAGAPLRIDLPNPGCQAE